MLNYLLEAQRVAQKLAAIRKDDSLVFPIFTDIHVTDTKDKAFIELQNVLAALSQQFDITALMNLGDNLEMLGREMQASNETIAQRITDLHEKVSGYWDRPFFTVHGNHDGIGTDFFDPEFWYGMVGGKFDKGQEVHEGHSAYYYVDYPVQKLRMVFLSLPCGCDLDAEYPTPLWKYGNQQLRWLADTALDTPYPVLLVAHVPFYYEYRGNYDSIIGPFLGVFDGKNKRQSRVAALCGWIEDRDIAQAIFDSFQTHRAYDNEALGIHLAASKASCKLIACLSGHQHSGAFAEPGGIVTGDREATDEAPYVNTLPCPQFVLPSARRDVLRLERDGQQQYAMDIAVVTPSERTLTLLRYGCGNDRRIQW